MGCDAPVHLLKKTDAEIQTLIEQEVKNLSNANRKPYKSPRL